MTIEFNETKWNYVSEMSNPELEKIMHRHGEFFIMDSRKDMIETVYSYDDLIMNKIKHINTKVSEKLTLQFSAEYNEKGERLCTCDSKLPWNKCTDDKGFCG